MTAYNRNHENNVKKLEKTTPLLINKLKYNRIRRRQDRANSLF